MTKDKYLLTIIDNLIAPMTVIYFICENYLHKDYSEYFRRVLETYQSCMKKYDETMKAVDQSGQISVDLVDALLLCNLDEIRNKHVRGFLKYLNKEVIQKKDLNLDVFSMYKDLMESGNVDIDIYIQIIKELRQSEEIGGKENCNE